MFDLVDKPFEFPLFVHGNAVLVDKMVGLGVFIHELLLLVDKVEWRWQRNLK